MILTAAVQVQQAASGDREFARARRGTVQRQLFAGDCAGAAEGFRAEERERSADL